MVVHTINSSNPEGEVGGPLWGQHDLHSMIQASQRFIERNSQKNWGVTALRWENQEFKDRQLHYIARWDKHEPVSETQKRKSRFPSPSVYSILFAKKVLLSLSPNSSL